MNAAAGTPIVAADARRALPAVETLLQCPQAVELQARYGRPLTLAAARTVLDAQRATLREAAGTNGPGGTAELLEAISLQLAQQAAPTLHSVTNATGVIIHTNLGRAPLSKAAQAAMLAVADDYCTLEYDPRTGTRGSRNLHPAQLLRQLTGAEDALVVNNCAAALLLALTGLAKGKGVVISRGQLVEIGGGFRIPDVMMQSGARLVEVGTTNRTHAHDYASAIGDPKLKAALLLRVHHSNFRIEGFATEPGISELTALGAAHSVPVVDCLGSGALLDTTRFGLAHEPMVQESVAAGCDAVCFSGDKLLGGPQCGIIVGRAATIQKLAKHPLVRALRADKLCLAALSATLLHYLHAEAPTAIPVWRMISMPLAEIEARAQELSSALRQTGLDAAVIDGQSTVGGGSLPGETLPTKLVAVRHRGSAAQAARLRTHGIIARVQEGQLLLDPRTVGDWEKFMHKVADIFVNFRITQ